MARTPSVTDEEIFTAAGMILSKRGPDNFTIAEVAGEVGLSRAAIILRFQSTQGLKIALLTKMVDQFAQMLTALPQTPGGNSLLAIADFVGQLLTHKTGVPSFFTRYSENMKDSELGALEWKRGHAFHAAIAKAMPAVNIAQEKAVQAYTAQLTGSIMAWIGSDDNSARHFLVSRTIDWLQLAGIDYDQDYAHQLPDGPRQTRPTQECHDQE